MSSGTDPFAALGLPARADVTDDDVRAAWRRIAAATHPDRDDGGDPAVFASAAAAYATLRTSDGRGETLADLREARDSRRYLASIRRLRRNGRWLPGGPRLTAAGRHIAGRHWAIVLAVRVLLAATAGALAVLTAGWSPGSIAVLTGALTWCISLAWRFPRPEP